MRLTLSTLSVFALLLHAGCGGSSGKPLGPPAPVRDTIRVYTGRIAYFTTGPRLGTIDANRRLVPETGFSLPNIPRGAPHFTVEILDASGRLLDQGITDTGGNYSISINYGQNPAPAVLVRVLARISIAGGAAIRVSPSPASVQPYSKSSPLLVDTNAETIETDITIALDEGAGAFFILESLYDPLVIIRSGILGAFHDLDIFWAPGNGDRSSFLVNGMRGELTVAGGLAGVPASNQDTWDPSQLVRLLGEYFLALYSTDSSPLGTPNDALMVPSVAWREGFLDFFSCALRGSPIFWDTEGVGDDGRVVRYFDIESFFDPALPPVGPDDPNVYQDPAAVGLGSRFTVAEVMWDIFDFGNLTRDGDLIEVPLNLMLRDLDDVSDGAVYAYLYSFLDEMIEKVTIRDTRLDTLLLLPENQGLRYPATEQNGLVWPTRFFDPAAPDDPLAFPFDDVLSDAVDNATPVPLNEEIGLTSQRYFQARLANDGGRITADVTSAVSLRVEILDLDNNVLASGVDTATAAGLEPRNYVIRVLPLTSGVTEPFDLRLRVFNS